MKAKLSRPKNSRKKVLPWELSSKLAVVVKTRNYGELAVSPKREYSNRKI
jgi:hypothetical protein